jgi:hypothetical protein
MSLVFIEIYNSVIKLDVVFNGAFVSVFSVYCYKDSGYCKAFIHSLKQEDYYW